MFKSMYSLVFIDDEAAGAVDPHVPEPNDSLLGNDDAHYDFTMDDRASIYLDTISLASDYPIASAANVSSSTDGDGGSAMANNRKSMSMSRQTIYHSAEDLQQLTATTEHNSPQHIEINGFTGRAAADSLGANVEFLHAQRLNGSAAANRAAPAKRPRNGCLKNSGAGSGGLDAADSIMSAAAAAATSLGSTSPDNDEVTKSSNKHVTYSEWKSRTWRRFTDGQRTVDFVLAYPSSDPHPRNADKRRTFEANLQHEGLQLEREQTQHIHFVKIHAPQEVLCRYCEILKMRMPIKRVREQDQIKLGELQLLGKVKEFCGRPFDFVDLDKRVFPEEEYRLKHEFSRNHSYLFDEEKPGFFTQTISHAVVHFILERMRFSEEDDTSNNVGIEKLLAEGVYEAAYPLHDGDCHIANSQRNLLFTEWASVSKWIKHQPLDHIKEYFGVKVALYFAWLGFYTHMLIPASIVGIVCFLFGLLTLQSNSISSDVCKSGTSIVMCPQCDEKCDYWYLSDTCVFSRISHLFDNNFTVVFACFMSFWAVLYLELWKRYSAKLIHQWGCSDFTTQAEHPRPEYLSRLKTAQKKRFNVIHRVLEPHVPFWKAKFPAYLLSYSVVFLFICLAISAVFGVVIYRMSMTTSRSIHSGEHSQTYNMIVLPATAAFLNLAIITVLNYAYDYLAVALTNCEYRRTQTEFDESLTLKIYLFQFVNYYSSIFYVAFLKGKFVGYPAKYNRLFGFRQEECSPGGCLMELCIQLVIIMVGKQAMNAVLEMFVPYMMRRLNGLRRTWGEASGKRNGAAAAAAGSAEEGVKTSVNGASLITCNQWTNDYKLLAWSARGLFDDYLEMIIQFGFVTIFVVAFPLAPLFALLNNIFEMRLDAQKFLKYYRRPVPCRVKDIGVWFNIMAILSRISTASSAFIIAFSSNFIPRLVYMMSENTTDHTDEGYLNFTLSYFATKDFQPGTAPLHSKFENVTLCRYAEYRNPHTDPERPYKRGITYWHILAARLAFLVLFENVMGLVQMFVAWVIPDVPRKLSDQMKREDYLTREIIIEQEKLLAQTAATVVTAASASDGQQQQQQQPHSSRLHAALKNDLFAGAAELSTEGNELLHRRASRRAAATEAAASTGGGGSLETSSGEDEEQLTQLTNVDETKVSTTEV